MGATQQMGGHRFHGPAPAQEVSAPMRIHDNPYPAAEQLNDRIRHAIVFTEATLRALREALEILEAEKSEP
jgi:hypothetical protein